MNHEEAQNTFDFPTVRKITKAFGFIKIGHITKILCEKNAPQARFFDEKIAPQAKLMKQTAPQARLF